MNSKNNSFEGIPIKRNLSEKLNMQYTDIANSMEKGMLDIPKVCLDADVEIDYLCLFKDRKDYQKTKHTAICFYQYDSEFDGMHGLYQAIYYHDEKLLQKFKERLKDARFVIMPDYSITEDMDEYEKIYRIAKSRMVAGWLAMECDILVIPNLQFGGEADFPLMVAGIEVCSMLAVSLKGSMKDPARKAVMIKAINYAIDHMPKLRRILVYSSVRLKNDEFISYPRSKNIRVDVPLNSLMERNLIREGC